MDIPLIVPICIYHKKKNVEGISQGNIQNPIPIGNINQMVLRCFDPEKEHSGWYLAAHFYAINPMIVYIPSYLTLICATQIKEFPYGTESISYVYDPFKINGDCVSFIAWTQPAPYTTPLYIYKGNNTIIPSFELLDHMVEAKNSPVYVLTADRMKNTVIGDNWFLKDKNNIPKFLFRNEYGRCIPDHKGITLESCIVQHNKTISNYDNIITRLNPLYVSIIFGLFLIAIFILIYLMYTK
jgi:hypothetical protein